MTQQVEVSQDELEQLFVNNEQLDRLSAYLNRFNPIRTMQMEGMEVRHSAILAWLLDPAETHGFGDRFLKAFLSEAFRGHSALGKPDALDISQADLRDAEVRREWQNIDIFILSRRNDWAFVIENKFYASQREGQLSSYVAKVRTAFEPRGTTLAVRGIFLTLLDEEPQDQRYAPIRYWSICELLPRLIALEGLTLGQEVAIFLGHYLEVIRDATGMSSERKEMEELARQLYRTHKKALDFVLEHGASTDFVLAAASCFQGEWEYGSEILFGSNRYMYSHNDNVKISFIPQSWKVGFGGDDYTWGCDDWWAGYPLICWLQLFENADGASGMLKLFAEVGPMADQDGRAELIKDIKAVGEGQGHEFIRFQRGADKPGKRYSKFLKSNSVDVADIHDAEEIAKAMAILLNRFQPYFDGIADALPKFLKFAEKVDE